MIHLHLQVARSTALITCFQLDLAQLEGLLDRLHQGLIRHQGLVRHPQRPQVNQSISSDLSIGRLKSQSS